MATTEESGNSTTMVAIVAIMVILAIGTLVAWRMGLFARGSGDKTHSIDVNVR